MEIARFPVDAKKSLGKKTSFVSQSINKMIQFPENVVGLNQVKFFPNGSTMSAK